MNREYFRKTFYEAWQKHLGKKILSPLEMQIVDIIKQHPEYHEIILNPDINHDFSLDENPYLHMSLHLGLLEQLKTQRPKGINSIYENLKNKLDDAHKAQHQIMNIMAELIWEAQKNSRQASDEEYLIKLEKLC